MFDREKRSAILVRTPDTAKVLSLPTGNIVQSIISLVSQYGLSPIRMITLPPSSFFGGETNGACSLTSTMIRRLELVASCKITGSRSTQVDLLSSKNGMPIGLIGRPSSRSRSLSRRHVAQRRISSSATIGDIRPRLRPDKG